MSEEYARNELATTLQDIEYINSSIQDLKEQLEAQQEALTEHAKYALNMCEHGSELHHTATQLYQYEALRTVVEEHLKAREIPDVAAFLAVHDDNLALEQVVAGAYLGSMNNLKYMPYRQYLETDHWKQLRREMIEWADGRCQICNQSGRLQVHHRTYVRRGEERLSDLILLCANCHDEFHKKRQVVKS